MPTRASARAAAGSGNRRAASAGRADTMPRRRGVRSPARASAGCLHRRRERVVLPRERGFRRERRAAPDMSSCAWPAASTSRKRTSRTRTRPSAGARDRRGPAPAKNCRRAATTPGRPTRAWTSAGTRRSIRLRASVSRSSPRISSSGHRTFSVSDTSAVVCVQPVGQPHSLVPDDAVNRVRRAGSISGCSVRVSIAARMLASAPRVPSTNL